MVEIGPHLVRGPVDIGRSDGLVRFLCIRSLRLVDTVFFRDISRAIAGADIIAQCGDGLRASCTPSVRI